MSADLSGSQEVKHSRQDGCEDNPEQREPVKERHSDEGRVNAVVKRRIQQHNERNKQEDAKPGTSSRPVLGLWLRTHKVSPLARSADTMGRNQKKSTGKTCAGKQ